MKTHLTDSDIFDMVFDKFNIANPDVDNISEYAERLQLEYDEAKEMYYNPDCTACGKELKGLDLKWGKKSNPKLCIACFTGNA